MRTSQPVYVPFNRGPKLFRSEVFFCLWTTLGSLRNLRRLESPKSKLSQMGSDLGLGGCWPAGYYLVYSKNVIYVSMYSPCLPMYLCANMPVMCDSLLYWLLSYLCRNSNLLTYQLAYAHTYITTCIPTYLHTYVPLYLHNLALTHSEIHTCIIYIQSLVL